jgi:hypothetical protein
MNWDFISAEEALKLVPPFKGNKQEFLAFSGNVDSAFVIINPRQEAISCKFVSTHISGEPRMAICHRNLDSWADLIEFLQNAYIEKQTIDFRASQLFKARQGRYEKVVDWIHEIQTMGSQFREAALLNCCEGTREGTLHLTERLRNICFLQGLASDRIQTIVRSCNYHNFDETALVEESAIASKQKRYRAERMSAYMCSNCGKPGHSSNKCYSRSQVGSSSKPCCG